MKKILLLSCTLACLLLILWTAAPLQADAQEKSSLKIGFVNFREVFDKYLRTEKVNQEIQRIQDDLKNRMGALVAEGRTLEDALTTLREESPEYKTSKDRLMIIKSDVEALQKSGIEKIESFVLVNFEKIYIDIREAIAAYGTENNYTMIMKVDSMTEESIQSESKFELNEKIHHRPVLFFDQRFDLTQAIIDILNE